LTPVEHSNRAMGLTALGIALQRRFERTGSMDDLDRAILTSEQAVKLTPVNHPSRAIYLNNFGSALAKRFERKGSMGDLDRTIMVNEQAVKLNPVGHPDRAGVLLNLGNALLRRFLRTGSMDDLDLAVVRTEQAVESSTVDHSNYAGMLNSLGVILRMRFERTGSMDDLDRAIVTIEQAVELTPVNHPYRAGRLSNLGFALQIRFERTGLMDNLDRAIVANERAVQSTPVDHPDLTRILSNLGSALRRRFVSIGSMDDLDRSIMTQKQAVESTPVNHPARAGRLSNFGISLQERFERTGSTDDLNNAIMAYEQAAKADTAPLSIRLKAAQSCSDMLISQRSYSRAKYILEDAVHLLPRVSPRQLTRSDQQFNISQFINITSRAVSLSLQSGDEPYKSLQLLEFGRGIISNLQLEVRSDISALASAHPDLAQKFQELRDRIDIPLITFESSVIRDSSASHDSASISNLSKFNSERRALFQRFDDILQCIRSLHGFEDFLQGPSESELRSLAEGGAIVVFNVSGIRSDAFLITTDKIRSVHLPLLTSGVIKYFGERFLDAINEQNIRRYSHGTDQLNIVLKGLWDLAVEPILAELGFTQMPPPGEAWPRVWWIGNSLLSILPIHASGYHNSAPPRTVLDRVISSYAPAIKSLKYARERAIIADQSLLKEKAIVVAMPTTPEQKSLPFVEREVKDLENLFIKASVYSRIMQNPTRAEILSRLPQYIIVHFACHGYLTEDPSQSSLLLEDGPITVSDLASLNIKSAKFAYLSACHSSTMRSFGLLDESISLSSAILKVADISIG
jgi:tetratricopeptide (TPR) repeat protein